MQSILELVWYFFYPNSPEPDWFSVTACDVPSQTSVAELNIGQTSLISPILPTDCDLFLSNCSLLSHISVTPTGLAICSHHLHLIIGLHLIHCWLTCFFHQIEKTVHFVLLCNCLQQTKRFNCFHQTKGFQTKVVNG